MPCTRVILPNDIPVFQVMSALDTTDPELILQGAPRELRRVLDRTLHQLADIDADTACIDAFKTEIVDKFLSD